MKKYLDDLNRFSAIILLIIIIVLSLSNNISITYSINYILSDKILNAFLKNIVFKNLLGDKKHPILGTGTRPPGAKNCGLFRDNFFNPTIKPKLATSYGFPSGHSQSAGYFMTFIHEHFSNNSLIYISSLLYSLYIPYTRIELNCHTYQQVIFGYLFGILTYYLFEYVQKLINKIIYNMKNNKEETNKNN